MISPALKEAYELLYHKTPLGFLTAAGSVTGFAAEVTVKACGFTRARRNSSLIRRALRCAKPRETTVNPW